MPDLFRYPLFHRQKKVIAEQVHNVLTHFFKIGRSFAEQSSNDENIYCLRPLVFTPGHFLAACLADVNFLSPSLGDSSSFQNCWVYTGCCFQADRKYFFISVPAAWLTYLCNKFGYKDFGTCPNLFWLSVI